MIVGRTLAYAKPDTNSGDELATATTRPIPVDHFVIADPQGMAQALISAMSLGMRGSVTAERDREGNAVWHCEIVDHNNNAISANIGDVYVYEATLGLMSMTQEEFDSRYILL